MKLIIFYSLYLYGSFIKDFFTSPKRQELWLRTKLSKDKLILPCIVSTIITGCLLLESVV